MAFGDPVAHVSGSDFYAEINGSSGFTGTWGAITPNKTLDGCVATMILTAHCSSNSIAQPTITIGGLVPDITMIFQDNADEQTPGSGFTVLVAATTFISATSDDTVEIEWEIIGQPSVDIIVQGSLFQNVDGTFIMPVSPNEAFAPDTLMNMTDSATGDMIVDFGGHLTGAAAAPQYEAGLLSGSQAFTMVAGGSLVFFGSGSTEHQQGFGYWEVTETLTARTTFENAGYQWQPGLTLRLPRVAAPAVDDFNCECDDETDYETLGALRQRLLIRLGFAAQATNPPPGMVLLLNEFLLEAQRFLYRSFKALRTERFFKWEMTEGERFYDLPANDDTCSKKLDPYRATWAGIEDANGVWTPLVKGIPPTFYTGVNFNGLPERYEIRQCIEVFPAPIADLTLRIKGHFGLGAFTADDDKTSIDSELVFLWALANAKAHYGHPDASNIASQANSYRRDLVKGGHLTARYVPGRRAVPPAVRPLFLGLDT